MKFLKYKECVILRRRADCSTIALGGFPAIQAVWSPGPDGAPLCIASCGGLVVECWEELPVLEFVMWSCQDSFWELDVSRRTGTVQNFLESNGKNIGLDFAALGASLAGHSLGPTDCENTVKSLSEHVQISVEGLYSLFVGFCWLFEIIWICHCFCIFSITGVEAWNVNLF